MVRWSCLLLCLQLLACGSAEHGGHEDGAAGAAGAPAVVGKVQVGQPTGPDGLEFGALEPGSELRLKTFGQGGTHVLVGVRTWGFGSRAFVSATLQNLTTGVEVNEPAPARPQLLFCDEAGTCELVPYLVHATGLTESPEERDGLRVLLTATARNEDGVMAEDAIEIVLSTADL
jgi:hypothetical protein